jgi:hypothetical protein
MIGKTISLSHEELDIMHEAIGEHMKMLAMAMDIWPDHPEFAEFAAASECLSSLRSRIEAAQPVGLELRPWSAEWSAGTLANQDLIDEDPPPPECWEDIAPDHVRIGLAPSSDRGWVVVRNRDAWARSHGWPELARDSNAAMGWDT